MTLRICQYFSPPLRLYNCTMNVLLQKYLSREGMTLRKLKFSLFLFFCQTQNADCSPAGPGVIVSCVLLKPGEVKKVKETNGFI